MRILVPPASHAPRAVFQPFASIPTETARSIDEIETVTAPDPEPVLIVRAERSARKSRVILATDGPYLPAGALSPLRFAATRRWPAPLPAPEPVTTAAASRVAAAVTAEVATEESADEPIAAATTPADPTPPPVVDARANDTPPSVLTADMVLGFLGDLPVTESRTPVRFEPALPQGAGATAGSVSP